MELEYTIKNHDVNETINNILLNKLKISSRLLTKLIKNNCIYLNNKICDTRSKAIVNDLLKIDFNIKEDNSNIFPTKMDLNIIYEDEWMLVVNKPYGIPIHPSRLHYKDSLSNGIKFYFDSINLNKKIRCINRLDLDTSGVTIFAKCEYIQECFIKQMVNNTFKKEYLCLVDGIFEKKVGTISMPISRKEGSIIERCVDTINGKIAITNYKVLNEFKNYSLVKCILETGRTHQIRVHMANIGHPILSDTLYSTKSNLINRQALHSYRINCIHPISKKHLIFESKIPNDMESLINLRGI